MFLRILDRFVLFEVDFFPKKRKKIKSARLKKNGLCSNLSDDPDRVSRVLELKATIEPRVANLSSRSSFNFIQLNIPKVWVVSKSLQ